MVGCRHRQDGLAAELVLVVDEGIMFLAEQLGCGTTEVLLEPLKIIRRATSAKSGWQQRMSVRFWSTHWDRQC
jgi:hypothetical protein